MYVFRGTFGIANITVALLSVAITMLTFNLTVKDIRSSLFFIILLSVVSALVLYEIAVVIYVLSISLVIDRRGISYSNLFSDVKISWNNIEKIEESKIKFKMLHRQYLTNYYKIVVFYHNNLESEKLKKISISQEMFEDYKKISKLINRSFPFEQSKRSGILG